MTADGTAFPRQWKTAHSMIFLIIRLVLLCLLGLYVLCIALIHFRGKHRLRFDRQLVDHSGPFAPYNLLMYTFSAVPARAYLDRADFPQLNPLQQNWQMIRGEAERLFDDGFVREAAKNHDASFDSFFKQGWQRFYLKWYGEALPSAEILCPKTLALLNSIPDVKAAMFTLLAPGSKLNPHRDPFAGSLRYHLGLITPNSEKCRIYVDGEPYAWRDGEDVMFDETYLHWVRNDTDQARLILFCDVERPLRGRMIANLNRRFSRFMGRLTASPNGANDQTGLINRLYAASKRRRDQRRAFKQKYPQLFRLRKYAGIVLVLWILFLAPWPLLR